MSGIAGIYNLDGRPVDRALLRRMTDVIAHRGPDGAGHWIDGPVGLGHTMLHTTPESLHEKQPVVDETGNLCLTLDGRVDNRDELGAALKTKGVQLRTDTDAEMVLRAYECWREECPKKIIGDFAFVIWDKRCHQLFCSRDALGIRPFYYYKSDTFLAFASDPAAVFALPKVVKRPNLDALVNYLANYGDDSEPTEFEQLYRLRPAHSLTVTTNSIQCRQYWDVDPNRLLRLSRFEEYEEAFLEVFTRVITAQLRSNGRVGMVFSGGLDSSSILCLIEDLKASGKVRVDSRAYSSVFDGQPYDESNYMRSVQERWGTEIHWLRPQPPTPLWGRPEALCGEAQPRSFPLSYMIDAPLRAAASEETRVLLGGLGGDDFMNGPTQLAADLLVTGHPLQAWRLTATLGMFQQLPLFRAVRHALVRPLFGFMPRWAKDFYRIVRPARTSPWLREPHAHAVVERLRREPWYLRGRRFQNNSRRETYSAVHSGYRVDGLEWWDRLAATCAVEVRQPFCDRRLVELASSIPDKEMMRGGEQKGLLRAALGLRLPVEIRQRKDKADFLSLVNYRMIFSDASAVRTLLTEPYLEQLDLIDGEMARAAYHTYCRRYSACLNNSGVGDVMFNLMWQLLSLEAWVRGVFGQTKSASQQNDTDTVIPVLTTSQGGKTNEI